MSWAFSLRTFRALLAQRLGSPSGSMLTGFPGNVARAVTRWGSVTIATRGMLLGEDHREAHLQQAGYSTDYAPICGTNLMRDTAPLPPGTTSKVLRRLRFDVRLEYREELTRTITTSGAAICRHRPAVNIWTWMLTVASERTL